MRAFVLAVCAWAISFNARAHGFDERYDLPVPLHYVVAGACATVFFSFVIAVLFVRPPKAMHFVLESGTDAQTLPMSQFTNMPFSNWLVCSLRVFSFLLFVLTIVSALWGSGDPLMNLAPTLVWIVWWIGMSFAVMLFGNFWPVIDPWRSTFDALDFCARKLGRSKGLSAGKAWPTWLGVWPAVFLLLLWCWLEVVYPIATSPWRLGCAALIWYAVNVAGMACFGRNTWQRHADVFALYFSMLGRMAPLEFNARWPVVFVRPWGDELIYAKSIWTISHTGFVMAMLSTVLFDGLHGGVTWTFFEQGLRKICPQRMDVNGYFAGTIGLIVVWASFLVAYLATCRVCVSAVITSINGRSSLQIAVRFAPPLISIAGAYTIAHNFSSLMIQGQTVFQLLSDPLGRQWDLFGTARFYPDISVVDARLTWYVAVGAIVAGHVVSIWLSHRVALNLGLSVRRTALLTIPLTVLMLVYTAISLSVIAEPMVSYTPDLIFKTVQ